MFSRGEKEVYLTQQIKKSIYNVAKRMLNLTGEINIKANRVREKRSCELLCKKYCDYKLELRRTQPQRQCGEGGGQQLTTARRWQGSLFICKALFINLNAESAHINGFPCAQEGYPSPMGFRDPLSCSWGNLVSIGKVNIWGMCRLN